MTISKKCNKYKLLKTKKNKKYFGGNNSFNHVTHVEGGKKHKEKEETEKTEETEEKDSTNFAPGIFEEIKDGVGKSVKPVISTLASSAATGFKSFADNIDKNEKQIELCARTAHRAYHA